MSPLLANVVLNKLDWFLHSKGFYGGTANLRRSSHNLPNVRFARYADDWCVFLTRCNRQYAERLKDEIRDFLRETCGLELSAEKTRITHVRDGYDFLGFNISTGVGKSGTVVPKVKVGRKAIANIQTRLGEVLRYRPMQESISVRLDRASAVVRGWSNYFKIAHNFSQSCPRAGPQGFLDRGESDMQEGRHIDCPMPPQVRLSEHHWGSRRMYAGPLPGYGTRPTTLSSPKPYQPGCNSRTRKTTNGRRISSSPTVNGQAAETSSGRLWSATAFIAVGARLRLPPRPRTRTILNLSTALPTSTWRTAWTTSRRFVIGVTSLSIRGNHVLRIIWKAGCLETCTSGLGLGSGCNSPAYTTPPRDRNPPRCSGLRPIPQGHAVSRALLRAVDQRQWRPRIFRPQKGRHLPRGGKHPAWKAPGIPRETTTAGFDIETVEIKGRCPVIVWGRRRGEVTNYKAGVLAKIPRNAERFDELKATTTLTIQQLRVMVCQEVIPAVNRIISIPAPRVVPPTGKSTTVSKQVSTCPAATTNVCIPVVREKVAARSCSDRVISEAELEKLSGHYRTVATTLMGVHPIKTGRVAARLTTWPFP